MRKLRAALEPEATSLTEPAEDPAGRAGANE